MKVLVNGAGGRMGQVLMQKIRERGDVLCGAVDRFQPPVGGVSRLEEVAERADVIIDFSNREGTVDLLEYALREKIPVVVATTGHTEAELALISSAAEKIPIFYSGNMSFGIALLTDLVKRAVAAFPGADVEIVEVHHNRKEDAPSGTALMLADAVKEVRTGAYVQSGRNGRKKRETAEIGISAVRMGNIVGRHEVLIGTDSETISLKHEAHDRALFADGALRAAEFLISRPVGKYDMKDLFLS